MDLRFELPWQLGALPDLDLLPDRPGVFLLQFEEGKPYFGRSASLRRRLKRLLQPVRASSLLGNLAGITRRVFYQPTGSAFESMFLLYELARRHLPDAYRQYLKLRPPPLVKVHLANAYPRAYVTTKLTRGRAMFFGPFLSRASAERFEAAFLDLFKIRRCQENLDPHAGHPGCIYGEMDMCLRPCQAAVSDENYQAEVGRVVQFLETEGRSLVREIEEARDQASAALEFEEAGRNHRRLEKVLETLKLKDDLARDLERFFGVVIQPSLDDQAVDLWFIYKGFLQPRFTFSYAIQAGRPSSLDRTLREGLSSLQYVAGTTAERADHLALLRRWYGSSWRSGELVLFDGMDRMPYRRLVNAISRGAGTAPAQN
jgi:excinuclease UvrABC nuclease subunit